MDGTVTIEIPVSTEAAAALADADRRAALGRYVSRMLSGAGVRDLLAEAIADAKTEAQLAGLTDADMMLNSLPTTPNAAIDSRLRCFVAGWRRAPARQRARDSTADGG